MSARLPAALAAAVAAALVAAPAPAGAVELAGRTVLEASSSGVVPVTLPHDVIIPNDPKGGARGVEVSGGDRFAAVIIMPAPVPDGKGGLRFEGTPNNAGEYVTGPGDRPQDVTGLGGTLTAGRYWLYALTDGPPVRVTLELHGLTGTAALAPTAPVRVDVRSTARRVQQLTPVAGFIGAWGDFGTIERAGRIFSRLSYKYPVGFGPFTQGNCFYPPDSDIEDGPAEPLAFHPTCPRGQSFPIYAVAPNLQPSHGGGVSSLPVPNVYGPAGRWGSGWFLANGGLPPTDIKTLTAFIELIPPPGVPVLDPPDKPPEQPVQPPGESGPPRAATPPPPATPPQRPATARPQRATRCARRATVALPRRARRVTVRVNGRRARFTRRGRTLVVALPRSAGRRVSVRVTVLVGRRRAAITRRPAAC